MTSALSLVKKGRVKNKFFALQVCARTPKLV